MSGRAKSSEARLRMLRDGAQSWVRCISWASAVFVSIVVVAASTRVEPARANTGHVSLLAKTAGVQGDLVGPKCLADVDAIAPVEMSQYYPPLANACCTQYSPCPLMQPIPVGYRCGCASPYGWIPGVACIL